MEMLKTLFSRNRSKSKFRKKTLSEIRKILSEFSRKHISIVECVSKAGPLTTELIFLNSSVKKEKKGVYDSILIMVANYYVMLYMDMYTGYYAVSRKHTCNLVYSLVEEVLKETADKQKVLKSNGSDLAILKSRDFTLQMVEVYYRAGIEGCHNYITSSVYSVLLSDNKNLSVKRDHVEFIVRAIQAEKFLTGSFGDVENSLENTG